MLVATVMEKIIIINVRRIRSAGNQGRTVYNLKSSQGASLKR